MPIPAVCVLRLAKTRIEERLRPRQVLRFMRGFRRTIFPLAAGLVFASPGEDLRLPFFRGVTARDPRPSAGRGVAVPARVCGAFGWSWRLDSGGCFFFAAFGVGCKADAGADTAENIQPRPVPPYAGRANDPLIPASFPNREAMVPARRWIA